MKLKGPFGIESALPLQGDISDEHFYAVTKDGYEQVTIARDGLDVWVSCDGHVAKYTLAEGISEAAGKEAVAPMTGKVVSMPVSLGSTVKQGDTLAVLEAMKMEYRLEAEADGEVEWIGAEVGELVDLGHVLVRLK